MLLKGESARAIGAARKSASRMLISVLMSSSNHRRASPVWSSR
jgi:hypothetical protein